MLIKRVMFVLLVAVFVIVLSEQITIKEVDFDEKIFF